MRRIYLPKRCGEGCLLYVSYNGVRQCVIYQHGNNPEAVKVIPDIEIEAGLDVESTVSDWADSVHSYQSEYRKAGDPVVTG